jgi:hypothetical protein
VATNLFTAAQASDRLLVLGQIPLTLTQTAAGAEEAVITRLPLS